MSCQEVFGNYLDFKTFLPSLKLIIRDGRKASQMYSRSHIRHRQKPGKIDFGKNILQHRINHCIIVCQSFKQLQVLASNVE
jgi:hypothetical protein